jgi:hypothetical protein
MARSRVVGRKEAAAALEYLRAHSRVDLDHFLANADAATLLASPLGPTDQCLSVDDVAEYVESETKSISRARRQELEKHLAACRDCRANADLYERLLRRSTEEAAEPDATALEIEILHPDEIAVPAESEDEVELVLLARGLDLAKALTIDADSLILRSDFITARARSLKRLSKPMEYGARAAFAARFHVDWTKLHGVGEPELCDWVQLEGKTVSGVAFSTRSLLCFKKS